MTSSPHLPLSFKQFNINRICLVWRISTIFSNLRFSFKAFLKQTFSQPKDCTLVHSVVVLFCFFLRRNFEIPKKDRVVGDISSNGMWSRKKIEKRIESQLPLWTLWKKGFFTLPKERILLLHYLRCYGIATVWSS